MRETYVQDAAAAQSPAVADELRMQGLQWSFFSLQCAVGIPYDPKTSLDIHILPAAVLLEGNWTLSAAKKKANAEYDMAALSAASQAGDVLAGHFNKQYEALMKQLEAIEGEQKSGSDGDVEAGTKISSKATAVRSELGKLEEQLADIYFMLNKAAVIHAGLSRTATVPKKITAEVGADGKVGERIQKQQEVNSAIELAVSIRQRAAVQFARAGACCH